MRSAGSFRYLLTITGLYNYVFTQHFFHFHMDFYKYCLLLRLNVWFWINLNSIMFFRILTVYDDLFSSSLICNMLCIFWWWKSKANLKQKLDLNAKCILDLIYLDNVLIKQKFFPNVFRQDLIFWNPLYGLYTYHNICILVHLLISNKLEINTLMIL